MINCTELKRLGIKNFQLEWDTDYGIDKREGWSLTIDGEVVCQFEDSPQNAVKKGMETWMERKKKI